jgi:hypothetical protein
MAYRFVLADDVDSERVRISSAAGDFLIGTALEEDELEPVDAILVEDAESAAILRDVPALKEEGSDVTPASEHENPPNLTGTVPESVAEDFPERFRNTPEDRIVADEELEEHDPEPEPKDLTPGPALVTGRTQPDPEPESEYGDLGDTETE